MAKILTFLALAFLLTLLLSALALVSGGTVRGNASLGLGIMWSPGVAAMVTCLVFQRNLRGLGWGLGRVKYLALSYIIPLLVGGITYAVIWGTGAGRFEVVLPFGTNTSRMVGVTNPSLSVALVLMLTVGLFLRLVFALGEEIGWRGFLLPHLARLTSLRKAAVLSGIIWAAYHLPGLLFLDYHSSSRLWSTLCFSIMAVSSSVIMAWLRMASGSLWTAAVFHASHNLAIQGVFDHFTADTGSTGLFAGEFGLVLPIAYAVAALWFWRQLEGMHTS